MTDDSERWNHVESTLTVERSEELIDMVTDHFRTHHADVELPLKWIVGKGNYMIKHAVIDLGIGDEVPSWLYMGMTTAVSNNLQNIPNDLYRVDRDDDGMTKV